MSSQQSLDVLWEPIRINGLEIRNRLLVSAHQMAFYDDEMMSDRLIDYYEERARGGVGLLITGAEGVHPAGWHPPHPQAWREDAAPRYRRMAERVNDQGGRVFTQLWHCGYQNFGTMVLENQAPVMGPSGLPSPVYGRIAKAMELEDIQEVTQAFGRAAELAQEAGINGVEVGGAHGYLISTFMDKHTNHRTDDYGGSLENRCRLAIEVATEVRRRCGKDFPMGFRMSWEEFVGPAGFEPDNTAELLREIHKHRLFDYFSVSGGTYHSSWAMIIPGSSPLETPYAASAEIAHGIVGGDVPIMVAGGVSTVEKAAEIVSSGKADIVAMTRAHLADPELANKARAGRASEIRRCIGANQGCVHRQVIGGMSSCTVNPSVGRERRWSVTKVEAASTPRRIQVVGAGPGGMKFAEAAAQRGHEVRLIERDDELGGQIRYGGRLPAKSRWLHLIEDLSGSLERLGVEIELGTEATPESLRAAEADLTVLATGSTWDTSGYSVNRPDRDGIPGADGPGVLNPIQAITEPGRVGDGVVIVDDVGNNAALGVAQLLGEAGKTVHIVTMGPMVGQLASTTFDVPTVLYPQLVAAGVRFHTWTTVDQITPETVSLREVWTNETTDVAADTVIMNILRFPEERLYLALKGTLPLRRIGDCLAPRQVDEAIYEAVELGFDLEQVLAGAGAARTAVHS